MDDEAEIPGLRVKRDDVEMQSMNLQQCGWRRWERTDGKCVRTMRMGERVWDTYVVVRASKAEIQIRKTGEEIMTGLERVRRGTRKKNGQSEQDKQDINKQKGGRDGEVESDKEGADHQTEPREPNTRPRQTGSIPRRRDCHSACTETRLFNLSRHSYGGQGAMRRLSSDTIPLRIDARPALSGVHL